MKIKIFRNYITLKDTADAICNGDKKVLTIGSFGIYNENENVTLDEAESFAETILGQVRAIREHLEVTKNKCPYCDGMGKIEIIGDGLEDCEPCNASGYRHKS